MISFTPAAGRCLALALALAATAVLPPLAHAGVYKCLRDDGGVFYQDAPCAPGRELRDFARDPANVSVVPFTPPPAATRERPRSRAAASEPRARKEAQDKPKRAAAERKGDARERRFLRPGMSEAEVIARVGKPDMTAARGRKGTRWTYMPVPEDRDTITNLVLENGRVAEIERKVIK